VVKTEKITIIQKTFAIVMKKRQLNIHWYLIYQFFSKIYPKYFKKRPITINEFIIDLEGLYTDILEEKSNSNFYCDF
jgi:hypothetical protein